MNLQRTGGQDDGTEIRFRLAQALLMPVNVGTGRTEVGEMVERSQRDTPCVGTFATPRTCFPLKHKPLRISRPVSYTHLTLPTNREV